MSQFADIQPTALADNLFQRIGSDWMLITAGQRGAYNTMTASWGGAGVLWGKNVAFVFVRPSRYTYEFMEKESAFSMSFFDEKYRDALKLCGAKSGRDIDKAAATGLTPCFDGAAPYFEQARLVVVCRKLYAQDLDPAQLQAPPLAGFYKDGDFHRMYVGEITQILQR
jgi:flavin reductase (DIM6/NTAB) family NADH-FMN oxidoreductase RutF